MLGSYAFPQRCKVHPSFPIWFRLILRFNSAFYRLVIPEPAHTTREPSPPRGGGLRKGNGLIW